MANNYKQSTVNPTLPKKLFTELELLTLAALGMQHEPLQVKQPDGRLAEALCIN